ncbi:MAG: ATP-binding protein [Desulfitobacteriaceae bacterium]|nr:ATP-binding protein [Desulfitobacteriaceae bacterium]MDI6881019.1 ATP-binding protein [Desulfitobacteriaceae bacterium]MDI6915288.1 ATP-binding protein [Desulfitobacteriaceae bacterium]
MGIQGRAYPFTALVGQERMKQALILNGINPGLGGVLIRGEKGTAKSTAVRALADLLPARNQVKGCLYACDPLDMAHLCAACRERLAAGETLVTESGKMRVIELPVSATEDRVVGTLDIEQALKTGTKKFEAGILAQANRNILYVDEVNLLEDHLVDLLLDAAAMGVNTVEREGVSFSHPARFVLVGTMNPEEGDLRPQLLDRFGLVVDVIGERDPVLRMEVVRRRLEFEQDPEAFQVRYAPEQEKLRRRIRAAQEFLPYVRWNEQILELVARLAIHLEVDGHRADLSLVKTAVTLAAYEGRASVSVQDVLTAAKLALPHRMRRRPFEEGVLEWAEVEKFVRQFTEAAEERPAQQGSVQVSG